MAKHNKVELPVVEGIHILSLIGEGHFSRVYKGVILENEEYVAVKVIDKKNLTQGKVEIIISEIGIMKSLNHPHIVRMLDFKWNSKSVYIILEYCEGGNLYEYIKLKRRLKESLCKRALQQLALGLAYLQEKSICHMDLKPQNVLIKFNPFIIKIADFGLAQYAPEKYYLDSLRGSPLYMAPEILLTDKYNSKVDLWSVGVILYECLYGSAPLAQKNLEGLIESHKKETAIKYPSTLSLSKDCMDLLTKLLTYNPDKRIGYQDFFEHPFLDLAHAPSEENKKLAFKIINKAVQLDEKKDYINAFTKYCQALRYLVPQLENMTASEERAYYQLKVSEYLSRAEELNSVIFKPLKSKTESKLLTGEFAADTANSSETVYTLASTSRSTGFTSSSFDTPSDLAIVESISNIPLSNRTSSSENSQEIVCSEGSEQSHSPFSAFPSCSAESSSSNLLTEDLFSSQNIKNQFAYSPKIHSALDIGFSGQMYMLQGDYEIAYSKYEAALSILIDEVREFPNGSKRNILLHQIKKWLAGAESAKTLASAKSIQLRGNAKQGIEVMDSNCSIQ